MCFLITHAYCPQINITSVFSILNPIDPLSLVSNLYLGVINSKLLWVFTQGGVLRTWVDITVEN